MECLRFRFWVLYYFYFTLMTSRQSQRLAWISCSDDTNIFIADNDINAVCTQFNDDLGLVQRWLACNKLSLTVKKTHHMVFTPRNKDIKDMDIKINKVFWKSTSYKVSWCSTRCQIVLEETYLIHNKLAKCAGILIKARKTLPKSSLINLYYCFAYPYLIYCNHVWGNNYPTNMERFLSC